MAARQPRIHTRHRLNMTNPQYLGDGVYAHLDDFGSVVITTGHHLPSEADNVIVLEPQVLAAISNLVGNHEILLIIMIPPLAHFTGIPHHPEDIQVLSLWPLALLAVQLVWIVVKQRTRQALQAVRQGLREARPFFLAAALLAVVYVIASVAQGAPAPVILRDSTAKVLGSIETTAGGVQELRDSSRRLLGTYDPRTNQTYDVSRRLIGTGNLLASLLKD